MAIEDQVFERKTLNKDTLETYGFIREGNTYTFKRKFLDGAFEAVIAVNADDTLSFKVIDTDSSDEYLPLNAAAQQGAYVNKVRHAYLEVLNDFASSCFKDRPFILTQTNRISEALRALYNESPDYPFLKYPTYAVFRYAPNRKWYALVMNIKRGLVEKDCATSKKDEIIEVVNLKVKSEKMDELYKIKGIYPGYHMGKASWISIVLDGRVSDDLILSLLDESRNSVKSGKVRTKNGKSHWIIPANSSFFDVIDYFSTNEEVIWKQSAGLVKGDIAYIYVTSPLSEIRFRCEVLETDIPYEHEDEHVHMKKVVKLKVLQSYAHGFCTLEKMRSFKVKSVRGQRTAPKELISMLEQKP